MDNWKREIKNEHWWKWTQMEEGDRSLNLTYKGPKVEPKCSFRIIIHESALFQRAHTCHSKK